MNTLVLPLPLVRRLLHGLAQHPSRFGIMRVQPGEIPGHRQWLVSEVTFDPPKRSEAHRLVLVTTSLSLLEAAGLEAHRPPPFSRLTQDVTLPWSVAGYLYLGEGHLRGQWWGTVAGEPLDRCLIPGPGMHQLLHQDLAPLSPEESERWSRTIGALGGAAIWQRLVNLSIAVIGCGRTGSLIAVALSQLDIGQLLLIDPDLVELHNLGEMDGVDHADLGRPKVQALADRLNRSGRSAVEPLAVPVTTQSALLAGKCADVLFCCADNDAARLTAAIIAALYHKVLLDIGTGIFYRSDLPERAALPLRTMGADIRLILPGDGCLLCRGNLANYAQALDDLCNYRSWDKLPRVWSNQRAGSLRSLNQLAAGIAVQMLQDLIAERITTSQWAHLESDDAGHWTVQYPLVSPVSHCPLCAKLGLGDEGLRGE